MNALVVSLYMLAKDFDWQVSGTGLKPVHSSASNFSLVYSPWISAILL